MESTSNIVHGWETLLLALNKHDCLKDPLSDSQKKMPVVNVGQNGNGLSLGDFPGIEVQGPRNTLPTLNLKHYLFLSLSDLDI